jgi:hypothetical protein
MRSLIHPPKGEQIAIARNGTVLKDTLELRSRPGILLNQPLGAGRRA